MQFWRVPAGGSEGQAGVWYPAWGNSEVTLDGSGFNTRASSRNCSRNGSSRHFCNEVVTELWRHHRSSAWNLTIWSPKALLRNCNVLVCRYSSQWITELSYQAIHSDTLALYIGTQSDIFSCVPTMTHSSVDSWKWSATNAVGKDTLPRCARLGGLQVKPGELSGRIVWRQRRRATPTCPYSRWNLHSRLTLLLLLWKWTIETSHWI